MRTNLKLAALALATTAAVLTTTGCKSQPAHPNQINVFDGATYDALTLTHGALTSLRASVAATYPQYKTEFNQAAASYATALNAYELYRTVVTKPNEAQVASAIQNLTMSIMALENAFEADLHVSSATAASIRAKAAQIRAAAGGNISVADILTVLEIAASIAETVPAAQPYAGLAAMVIEATDAALNAETAAAGQPIDLSTIQPLVPIS
ncbi:MAG: hypothetical protein JO091_10805 [Acidobacteriaceae bacterium]|nr:hypothetical protein [Acidobacteriaceae bacterium]